MSFKDLVRGIALEGFQSELSIEQILIMLGVAAAAGLYIYAVYRLHNRNGFYSKDFNITVPLLTLMTAAIVLALRSSLVISMGMVGALSIVRFRNAVKEPLDLMFLFWAIGTGMICGAGLFGLAILICLVMTVLLTVLQLIPSVKGSHLLVLQGKASSLNDVESKVKANTTRFCVKSRTLTDGAFDMIAEIRVKDEPALIDKLQKHDGVESVSILQHNGSVRY